MSYDIFCYKSKSGKPDEDEVNAIIEADTDKWANKDRNPGIKLAIIKALTHFNPKLVGFDFEYGSISNLTEKIIEENKNKLKLKTSE